MNTLKGYQVNENQFEQLAKEATAAHPNWKFAIGEDELGRTTLIGCEVGYPTPYIITSNRDFTTKKHFFEAMVYSPSYEEWIAPRNQIGGTLTEIITEIQSRSAYLAKKNGYSTDMNPVATCALKRMCKAYKAKRVS